MQSVRLKQLGLLLVLCALVAFLYFNGKNNSYALVGSNEASMNSGKEDDLKQGFDFSLYERDEKKKLTKEQIDQINGLQKQPESTNKLLKIAEKYNELEKPLLSGYYYFKLADKEKNNAEYWLKAGSNLAASSTEFSDSLSRIYLSGLAAKSYEKVLQMQPNNFDVKADLAAIYIETTPNPMRGVGMLREIVQSDSNNKKAILYLGQFSMKSGQYDKAIKRYQKLIELDGKYPFFKRYLADAYIAAGKKEEAIKMLELYKFAVKDKRLIEEANNTINKIKTQ